MDQNNSKHLQLQAIIPILGSFPCPNWVRINPSLCQAHKAHQSFSSSQENSNAPHKTQNGGHFKGDIPCGIWCMESHIGSAALRGGGSFGGIIKFCACLPDFHASNFRLSFEPKAASSKSHAIKPNIFIIYINGQHSTNESLEFFKTKCNHAFQTLTFIKRTFKFYSATHLANQQQSLFAYAQTLVIFSGSIIKLLASSKQISLAFTFILKSYCASTLSSLLSIVKLVPFLHIYKLFYFLHFFPFLSSPLPCWLPFLKPELVIFDKLQDITKPIVKPSLKLEKFIFDKLQTYLTLIFEHFLVHFDQPNPPLSISYVFYAPACTCLTFCLMMKWKYNIFLSFLLIKKREILYTRLTIESQKRGRRVFTFFFPQSGGGLMRKYNSNNTGLHVNFSLCNHSPIKIFNLKILCECISLKIDIVPDAASKVGVSRKDVVRTSRTISEVVIKCLSKKISVLWGQRISHTFGEESINTTHNSPSPCLTGIMQQYEVLIWVGEFYEDGHVMALQIVIINIFIQIFIVFIGRGIGQGFLAPTIVLALADSSCKAYLARSCILVDKLALPQPIPVAAADGMVIFRAFVRLSGFFCFCQLQRKYKRTSKGALVVKGRQPQGRFWGLKRALEQDQVDKSLPESSAGSKTGLGGAAKRDWMEIDGGGVREWREMQVAGRSGGVGVLRVRDFVVHLISSFTSPEKVESQANHLITQGRIFRISFCLLLVLVFYSETKDYLNTMEKNSLSTTDGFSFHNVSWKSFTGLSCTRFRVDNNFLISW
ncbi:hypothetical protein VP01_1709g1 [Puccinia sorghi]|uniref:Uncharacterized protein n=1 Tax=Puccinia sorghi TaxID=27349 RepID=A0A0L6VFL7_9BASI|nr:hypothetical protein VP01_1709g1 [Puccinia sorghi]